MTSDDAKLGRSRRWWVAVILCAATLGLPAAPTAADPGGSNESGMATGVGTEVLDATRRGPPQECLPVTNDSYYTIAAQGTVTAANTNSASSYTGDLTIVLDPVEPYYINLNPSGVFADADCTDPNVPATITVTSPGATSTMGVTSCGSADAIYTRDLGFVRYHGHGDCTVNGVQAGANTSHEFNGNLLPCWYDDPVTCGDAQIQGEYTET